MSLGKIALYLLNSSGYIYSALIAAE